jgi:putative membrane protein
VKQIPGKMKELLWVLIAVAFFAIIVPLLMWWPMGGFMMGGMMGFGGGYMILIPIAFVALIGIGAYYLITELMGTDKPINRQTKNAVDILKERYAKGEIMKDQYNEMRKEIEE